LLQAAAEVAGDDPAYLTLSYLRLRALRRQGQLDQARRLADQMLGHPDTDLSARNLILAEVTAMAPSLESMLKSVVRKPVEIGYPGSENGYAGNMERYRADPDLKWRTEIFDGQGVYFDDDVCRAINVGMPLEMVRIAAAAELPPHLRRQLLLVAFARSVLLDRPDTDIATSLHTFFPDIAELARLKPGVAADEQRFLAAVALLRLPGASPYCEAGLGRLAPPDVIGLVSVRWWDNRSCGGERYVHWDEGLGACISSERPEQEPELPPFLDGEPSSQARAELSKIGNAGAPATTLGLTVLAWAKQHPNDALVPEALHLVVRASRYGTGDCGSGKVSKNAHALLHSRYPGSPWTAKTRFWFDSESYRCKAVKAS
jgi:hypothetical protein